MQGAVRNRGRAGDPGSPATASRNVRYQKFQREQCHCPQEPHLPLPFEQVDQVVDTVGAGDGFCAGFLAGIAKGWTPEEALSLGGLTGSLVIQAPGDWEALPTWEEVQQRRGNVAHIER